MAPRLKSCKKCSKEFREIQMVRCYNCNGYFDRKCARELCDEEGEWAIPPTKLSKWSCTQCQKHPARVRCDACRRVMSERSVFAACGACGRHVCARCAGDASARDPRHPWLCVHCCGPRKDAPGSWSSDKVFAAAYGRYPALWKPDATEAELRHVYLSLGLEMGMEPATQAPQRCRQFANKCNHLLRSLAFRHRTPKLILRHAPGWLRELEQRTNWLPAIIETIWWPERPEEVAEELARGVRRGWGSRACRRLHARLACPPRALRDVWSQIVRVAFVKLQSLALVGDDATALAASARLQTHEWLAVDATLLHSHRCNEWLVGCLSSQAWLLHSLLRLVQRFQLEPSADRARWASAYTHYADSGLSSSPLVLQRRWWELKVEAAAAVRLRAAPPRRRPLLPHHALIARRYPHVVKGPVPSWTEMRKQNLIADLTREEAINYKEYVEPLPVAEDDLILQEAKKMNIPDEPATMLVKQESNNPKTQQMVEQLKRDVKELISFNQMQDLNLTHLILDYEANLAEITGEKVTDNERSVSSINDQSRVCNDSLKALEEIDPRQVTTNIIFESDSDTNEENSPENDKKEDDCEIVESKIETCVLSDDSDETFIINKANVGICYTSAKKESDFIILEDDCNVGNKIEPKINESTTDLVKTKPDLAKTIADLATATTDLATTTVDLALHPKLSMIPVVALVRMDVKSTNEKSPKRPQHTKNTYEDRIKGLQQDLACNISELAPTDQNNDIENCDEESKLTLESQRSKQPQDAKKLCQDAIDELQRDFQNDIFENSYTKDNFVRSKTPLDNSGINEPQEVASSIKDAIKALENDLTENGEHNEIDNNSVESKSPPKNPGTNEPLSIESNCKDAIEALQKDLRYDISDIKKENATGNVVESQRSPEIGYKKFRDAANTSENKLEALQRDLRSDISKDVAGNSGTDTASEQYDSATDTRVETPAKYKSPQGSTTSQHSLQRHCQISEHISGLKSETDTCSEGSLTPKKASEDSQNVIISCAKSSPHLVKSRSLESANSHDKVSKRFVGSKEPRVYRPWRYKGPLTGRVHDLKLLCTSVSVVLEKLPEEVLNNVQTKTTKRVLLPDIEQVRRDNQRLLVAQVAPLPHHSNTTTVDRLSRPQSLESSATNKSRTPSLEEHVQPADDKDLPGQISDAQLQAILHDGTARGAVCCAARRHRRYNDARRRLSARTRRGDLLPDVDLHGAKHGPWPAACGCCCRRLLSAAPPLSVAALQRALARSLDDLLRHRGDTLSDSSDQRKRSANDVSSSSDEERLVIDPSQAKPKRRTAKKRQRDTSTESNRQSDGKNKTNKPKKKQKSNKTNDATDSKARQKAKQTKTKESDQNSAGTTREEQDNESDEERRKKAEYNEWMRQKTSHQRFFQLPGTTNQKTVIFLAKDKHLISKTLGSNEPPAKYTSALLDHTYACVQNKSIPMDGTPEIGDATDLPILSDSQTQTSNMEITDASGVSLETNDTRSSIEKMQKSTPVPTKTITFLKFAHQGSQYVTQCLQTSQSELRRVPGPGLPHVYQIQTPSVTVSPQTTNLPENSTASYIMIYQEPTSPAKPSASRTEPVIPELVPIDEDTHTEDRKSIFQENFRQKMVQNLSLLSGGGIITDDIWTHSETVIDDSEAPPKIYEEVATDETTTQEIADPTVVPNFSIELNESIASESATDWQVDVQSTPELEDDTEAPEVQEVSEDESSVNLPTITNVMSIAPAVINLDNDEEDDDCVITSETPPNTIIIQPVTKNTPSAAPPAYFARPPHALGAGPPAHISCFVGEGARHPFSLLRLDAQRALWALPGGALVLTDTAVTCRNIQYYIIASKVHKRPIPVHFEKPEPPAARIKVRAFAKMPPERAPAAPSLDDMLTSDNKLYKRLGDSLIYGRVLSALTDIMQAMFLADSGHGLLVYCARTDALHALRVGGRALACALPAAARHIADVFNSYTPPSENRWTVVPNT